jgi:alpha-L-fucosidase
MLAGTRKSLCLAALLLPLPNITPTSTQTTAPVVPNATETKAQRDKRMKWWREARFGMFIHQGLYAVPAGEWKGKTIGGASE